MVPAAWLNPVIYSADDIVAVLQLPVVGLVPRQVMAAA